MAYSLPNFNLTVNVWRSTHDPLVDPPDEIILGNLTPGRRTFTPVIATGFPTNPVMYMELLVEEATYLNSWWDGVPGDYVEVPAGSTWFYRVVFFDRIGNGFGNAHRFALLIQKSFAP